MPGMTGLELLPKAKALRPDVPVIMITAYGDADTKRTALENGADTLFTKPIDFGALRSEIDMEKYPDLKITFDVSHWCNVHAEVRPEVLAPHRRDVDAVECDRAAIEVVEAHEIESTTVLPFRAKSSNLLLILEQNPEISPLRSTRKKVSLRFQHLNERLLRNVDLPDAFHSFFPFLLFLK